MIVAPYLKKSRSDASRWASISPPTLRHDQTGGVLLAPSNPSPASERCQYSRHDPFRLAGEAAREARFVEALDLGDIFIGSDEWEDVHLHPSHFMTYSLLMMMYNSYGLIGSDIPTTGVNKGVDVDARNYQMFAALFRVYSDEQAAIEAAVAVQKEHEK
jgi:hypothetical protein